MVCRLTSTLFPPPLLLQDLELLLLLLIDQFALRREHVGDAVGLAKFIVAMGKPASEKMIRRM